MLYARGGCPGPGIVGPEFSRSAAQTTDSAGHLRLMQKLIGNGAVFVVIEPARP